MLPHQTQDIYMRVIFQFYWWVQKIVGFIGSTVMKFYNFEEAVKVS